MTSKKKWAVTGFGIFLVFAFGITIFSYFCFKTIQVNGHSMDPTFFTGQHVLVSKAYWLVGPIKDNDVVVIREDEAKDYIIKRVYKMEHEVVDSMNVPKSYRIEQGPYKVPEGHIYVLGDNRPQSEDSRAFGPVPLENVIGKVVVRPRLKS